VRLCALGIVVATLVAAVASAVASPTKAPAAVRCDSIIVPGGTFSWRPERVVLGVVAVPPAHIPQTSPSGVARWPFWSKSGLVVRGNSQPVHVSVPERWRNAAAISWGNAGIASALRFASCPPSSALGEWNPYAGGFLLRSRSACVPLVFRVGDRTATVRFGVGERCR
jgi:hypothetical protein